MSLFTTIFFTVSSLANTKTYLNLNTQLEPGPHKIGFKVFHVYDYANTYAPQYDEDLKRSTKVNPRPMQIAVWYPSTSKAEPMPFREYVYLDATKDQFRELSEDDRKILDEAFINQRLFSNLGTANKDYLAKFLDFPTTVIKNGEAKEGAFPLLLFVNREYRGIHTNTVMMEYLASHGYIVATTPSKDHEKSYQDGMSDLRLIHANLSDIKFVKGYMHQFPNVDANKTGVIGYFVGSFAATMLSRDDQNIGAVVNLHSLLNDSRFGENILEEMSKIDSIKLDPKAIRAPLMNFYSLNQGQDDVSDFTDQMRYADFYRIKLNDQFDRLAFSSLFNATWLKSTDKHPEEALTRNDLGYGEILRYTHQFFEAYLNSNSQAKSFIQHTPNQNQMSSKTLSLIFRQGLKAPPTERQFAKMVENEGTDAAIAIYRQRMNENPDNAFLTRPSSIYNPAITISNMDGRLEESIELLNFGREVFPTCPITVMYLGLAHDENGDKGKAVTYLKESLSMNPSERVKRFINQEIEKIETAQVARK